MTAEGKKRGIEIAEILPAEPAASCDATTGACVVPGGADPPDEDHRQTAGELLGAKKNKP